VNRHARWRLHTAPRATVREGEQQREAEQDRGGERQDRPPGARVERALEEEAKALKHGR
jgi:hypothetical protein